VRKCLLCNEPVFETFDPKQPSERHEWIVNNEVHFTYTFPRVKSDTNLCYYHQKRKDKLIR